MCRGIADGASFSCKISRVFEMSRCEFAFGSGHITALPQPRRPTCTQPSASPYRCGNDGLLRPLECRRVIAIGPRPFCQCRQQAMRIERVRYERHLRRACGLVQSGATQRLGQKLTCFPKWFGNGARAREAGDGFVHSTAGERGFSGQQIRQRRRKFLPHSGKHLRGHPRLAGA